MLSLPLPFLLSFVLLLLLARMIRQAGRADSALIAFVAGCAVLAAVVGLRWGYGWEPAHYLQPILASALPALAWIGFLCLRGDPPQSMRALLPHFAATTAVAPLLLMFPPVVDMILTGLYVGYGTALLRLARQGSDSLAAIRIGDVGTAYRALIVVGTLLIISGLVDAAIAIDLGTNHGLHAPAIVTVADIIMLALAGYAMAVAENTRPPETTETSAPDITLDETADDRDIVTTIDGLMRERRLYRDPNLTLERLARRAGTPARRISSAVNRIHGRNVSQIVNEYRIDEARRLLAQSSDPITTVMLECGFQTKSNFNREFLRVVGMSPSAYRRALADGDAAPIAAATSPTGKP